MKDDFIVDYQPPISMALEPIPFMGICNTYDPEFNKLIIEHCSKGYSIESFAGKQHIDPDAMMEWCNQYQDFKASIKIAISAEFLYWEMMAQNAIQNCSDKILPTINRKLAQLEKTLLSTGLRASLYHYEEPDETIINDNVIEDSFT